ncbi:MAG: FAD-dependent oxidoreductase [Planctomycetota bacterium]
MDLTSDHPFWLVKNGLLKTYPPLDQDYSCDVAVVGAGITGAILAERLTRIGLAVIVVDGRDVCLGSTSATTALLQYEIDVPLVEMAEKIGWESARRAYRLSYDAIDTLEALAGSLGLDCGLERKTSIYLAEDKKKADLLAQESEARRECGIEVRLLGADELREEFHLPGTAALVSQQAASCDAYQFAHGLLAAASEGGAKVFDRTKIERFECGNDHVRLHTDREATITARQVVVATGYEAQSMLREQVADLKSTYALVSQPLASIEPWDARWIMWEAKSPYLYLRATSDNRLLVGGEDDPFRDPKRRDRRLPKKTNRIRDKVRALLPDLDWEVEFAWAGTFGETKDGLAYIGPTREYPHCYFALGFGGNGITFSAIAAGLLADVLTGKPNGDTALFRFGR